MDLPTLCTKFRELELSSLTVVVYFKNNLVGNWALFFDFIFQMDISIAGTSSDLVLTGSIKKHQRTTLLYYVIDSKLVVTTAVVDERNL